MSGFELKPPQSEFVRGITEEHLSTYFLLPLIQLNKFSFGAANFINSYVNRDGTVITVEVTDLRLCESHSTHPQYLKEKEIFGRSYIWFSLPERWSKDFTLFTQGKYSKLSEVARGMIIQFSGLTHNEGGITDARILALNKSQVLREKWEEELNMILPDNMELLSVPSEAQFREFE